MTAETQRLMAGERRADTHGSQFLKVVGGWAPLRWAQRDACLCHFTNDLFKPAHVLFRTKGIAVRGDMEPVVSRDSGWGWKVAVWLSFVI